MTGRKHLLLCAVVLGTALPVAACSDEGSPLEAKTELATCLTQNGWVMYGSITCSACRAKKKAFGDAFQHINEIGCNPTAPNTQVELCLEKKIGSTPTLIREVDGEEQERVEGYQLLDDLADRTDCPLGPGRL